MQNAASSFLSDAHLRAERKEGRSDNADTTKTIYQPYAANTIVAAGGGAGAERAGGHVRYCDGIQRRRSRHFRCFAGGYDQLPDPEYFCRAGHRRRGGGRGPGGKCLPGAARTRGRGDPAGRTYRPGRHRRCLPQRGAAGYFKLYPGYGCHGALPAAARTHAAAVLWQHCGRCVPGSHDLLYHHGNLLPVFGAVQRGRGHLPLRRQQRGIHAGIRYHEHYQYCGQCVLHLCAAHGGCRCCGAHAGFPRAGRCHHPETDHPA